MVLFLKDQGSQIPCWLANPTSDVSGYYQWLQAMDAAEDSYASLLELGWSPQQARSVLPNSLKTQIRATMNLREWRHVLRLRTARAAHPQMREVMVPLLKELRQRLPIVFDDIHFSWLQQASDAELAA